MLSPPFSVKVATPFSKVMSPYVPLIVVSESVTVNANSLVASAALPLMVLLTVRSPYVSLVFVNDATAGVFSSMAPVSPVFSVT